MGVINVTELATVSASRKFGEPPTFKRQWVVEVDDPSTPQTIITNSVPVVFLDGHPEAYYCLAFNVSVENYNGSRWHYLVSWDYELPKQQNVDPNPLARADIWKFTTSGMAVPALYYVDGGTYKPLVNAAGDFFEGAMTDLSLLKVHISGNRPTFNYATATAVTNRINASPYLGGAAYTWKCEGIAGQQAVEVVNEVEIRYWQVEVELTYRPDGWPLLLPHIGWNYIDGSDKSRVWVYDTSVTPKERVPASTPQALNSSGGLKYAGVAGTPDILTRQVHDAINFSSYFGTPPF